MFPPLAISQQYLLPKKLLTVLAGQFAFFVSHIGRLFSHSGRCRGRDGSDRGFFFLATSGENKCGHHSRQQGSFIHKSVQS